ncbi:MAG: methyltransferase domain-containing protein [Planctomycetes bacterium]|nr:methyltransferase domain-containing protein [Planctomycetota bacterium]
MRLYLGSGNKRLDGYLHVDIERTPTVDHVCDLNQLPWPWPDNSAGIIVAADVVEHLAINLIQFCDEAWRVIQPGGELLIRTPHHTSDNSWIDPTHRWHLNEQAFQYLDPDTHWGRVHPHYTQRKWRIVHLRVRGPENIHAVLVPRKT